MRVESRELLGSADALAASCFQSFPAHKHMCAIFGCFCPAPAAGDSNAFRSRAIALSKRQRHRGPDWSGVHVTEAAVLCHERLAIVGVGPSSLLV